MSVFHSVRFFVGLAILVVLMLLQALLPAPPESPVWSAVLDAGHVPLFGLLAYAVLRLSRASFPHESIRLRHYLLAFVVAAGIGFLTEAVQIVGPRDADLMDQERNLLGAAAALLLALTVDRKLLTGRMSWRVPLRGVALALVAAAWIPPAAVAMGYFERNASFPHLCGFEQGWESRFMRMRDVELEVIDPPPAWKAARGGKVGRITFHPARYPAFALHAIYPDWTGYDHLAFDVFSPADTTLTLFLRVDDAGGHPSYKDRFNTDLVIQPGANAVSIALDEVRTAPEGRTMDLHRMHSITLFTRRPEQPFSVYVDNVRLERNGASSP